MTDDPMAFAAAIGLRYVRSEVPPAVERRRCGRGFTYRRDGVTLSRRDPRRKEIQSLAIPPAWTSVWICPWGDGHLQATGYDDADRKQYRYHTVWSEARRRWKDGQLLEFGQALPGLRREVDRLLAGSPDPTEEVMHAAAARLLDATAIRVGNRRSVEEMGSQGLTTLTTDEVEFRRRGLSLSFIGKGGAERELTVDAPALADVLRAAAEDDRDELFTWREDDRSGCVTGASLNGFLKGRMGPGHHAHLFRSWHATTSVIRGLKKRDPQVDDSTAVIIEVVEPVAEALGHTVSTCRSHYIHHDLEESWRRGALQDLEPDPIEGLTDEESDTLHYLSMVGR